MRKHTPGPWQWNHGRLLHNVAGEYSETILDIEEEAWRPTDDDAKLIAAAPELLGALIAMEREKSDYMTRNNLGDPALERTNKLARAAIAKATA
ncbi:hypothetical protein [Pseudomonas aeruginosa]|uniref:hypothetical protein n=1 Tax=Pseudomonas aeruginosa TaxID=287 RepID=UPI003CEEBF4A